MNERPLIDYNGVVQPMTDEQYRMYLKMQEELANQPASPPDPVEQLRADVDFLAIMGGISL